MYLLQDGELEEQVEVILNFTLKLVKSSIFKKNSGGSRVFFAKKSVGVSLIRAAAKY
jgi:hypothetical protein